MMTSFFLKLSHSPTVFYDSPYPDFSPHLLSIPAQSSLCAITTGMWCFPGSHPMVWLPTCGKLQCIALPSSSGYTSNRYWTPPLGCPQTSQTQYVPHWTSQRSSFWIRSPTSIFQSAIVFCSFPHQTPGSQLSFHPLPYRPLQDNHFLNTSQTCPIFFHPFHTSSL